MPNVHIIHLLCYAISLDDEMYKKFEKHRGNRSYALTIRELVCTRLSVQPSTRETLWCYTHEINTQMNKHSKKKRANAKYLKAKRCDS
jgi:hypothetical protein